MKHIIRTLVFFGFICNLSAQQEGRVSFITSSNVYVKFDNTDMINKGDTLLYQQNEILIPCLVVRNISSTSCVSDLIQGCEVKKGEIVIFLPPTKEKEEEEEEAVEATAVNEDMVTQDQSQISQRKAEKTTPYEEKIRGRISAASYSNLSSKYNNRHRTMMRMSFRGDHLRGSRFSFETYMNYRQNFEVEAEKTTIDEGIFRVYNMALTYDVDSSMHITLGRKINRRASSLGAIDGLQLEKHFGGFYTGGIIGFRPDLYTYGLNTNLLEYGGYIGYESKRPSLYSSTTLGLLEQKNTGSVDRRYLYFQHHSNIGRSLYLFGSFELDLYAMINEKPAFEPRLTNLYVSARYRFSRLFDLTLSYDSRQNIIYYETLKTEIERLLDDEARQGARARINFRPFRYFNSGLSYSKRFQSSQQNQSNNINGYISHSKLPGIDGRLSVNYNWNQSSYLESRIISVRYSRSIIERKLDFDVYFRTVSYQYLSAETSIKQQYYGLNLDYNMGRRWMFSVSYELSKRDDLNTHRINTRIIRRFR